MKTALEIIETPLILMCYCPKKKKSHIRVWQQYISCRVDVWQVLSLQFYVFIFNEKNKGTHLILLHFRHTFYSLVSLVSNKSRKENGTKLVICISIVSLILSPKARDIHLEVDVSQKIENWHSLPNSGLQKRRTYWTYQT